MPSNICGAVIMWERDDVHSEWLWKAELGAMVRIYEDIPSLAQCRFFFFFNGVVLKVTLSYLSLEDIRNLASPSQGWCRGELHIDYVPLTNHNQLQQSPHQRAGISWDQTAMVTVVARVSLGPTHEQPVALAGPLLSPDQSLDGGPDHAGQQEQRCDQDVEEGEGGEGH